MTNRKHLLYMTRVWNKLSTRAPACVCKQWKIAYEMSFILVISTENVRKCRCLNLDFHIIQKTYFEILPSHSPHFLSLFYFIFSSISSALPSLSRCSAFSLLSLFLFISSFHKSCLKCRYKLNTADRTPIILIRKQVWRSSWRCSEIVCLHSEVRSKTSEISVVFHFYLLISKTCFKTTIYSYTAAPSLANSFLYIASVVTFL
jgi:hypothetical protein